MAEVPIVTIVAAMTVVFIVTIIIVMTEGTIVMQIKLVTVVSELTGVSFSKPSQIQGLLYKHHHDLLIK